MHYRNQCKHSPPIQPKLAPAAKADLSHGCWQAQLVEAQNRQVVLNIPVQDSAEELSNLGRGLREARAECAAMVQEIRQYQQAGVELEHLQSVLQAGMCA